MRQRKKMKKQKKQTQKNKFIEAAQEHGCEENEKSFSEKLKKLSPKKTKKDKH